jgi:hypothetical protein
MLSFEGQTYVTIADIKARFPVSEKKLKQLIAKGTLPEPSVITHGTRSFRHYSPEWQEELAKIVQPRSAMGATNV